MKKTVLFLMVLALALPLVAEEADPMAEMMKKWEAAATPGPQHKRLAEMEGKWKAEITMWMMPGAEPMKSTGTSTMTMIMGGRYLEQMHDGDYQGEPFLGRNITGYDNVAGEYVGFWIDNMGTGFMLSKGKEIDDGLFFDATYSDAMTGGVAKFEEKLTFIDHDTHMMEMWAFAPTGEKYRNMKIVYKRAK